MRWAGGSHEKKTAWCIADRQRDREGVEQSERYMCKHGVNQNLRVVRREANEGRRAEGRWFSPKR